jgi:carbon-monoxide dehydrogenase large subunit
VIQRGRDLAAERLETAADDIAYRDGAFEIVGTDRRIGLFELAAKKPFSGDAVFGDKIESFPTGVMVCEVEVDPETGDVRVVAYSSVNDIGRVVSPTIARGQVDGGAVQGLGQALSERVVYDEGSSQLVTGSFMDYAVPRADIGVAFRTEFDTSIPCLLNPLGVKGVGELGTIGATPAAMNAIVDALDHAGLGRAAEKIAMPATPERVWQALRGIGVAGS